MSSVYIKFIKEIFVSIFSKRNPRNLSELQAPQNLDLSWSRLFKETVKSALGTVKKKIVQNSSGSSLYEVLSKYKGCLEIRDFSKSLPDP